MHLEINRKNTNIYYKNKSQKSITDEVYLGTKKELFFYVGVFSNKILSFFSNKSFSMV